LNNETYLTVEEYIEEFGDPDRDEIEFGEI